MSHYIKFNDQSTANFDPPIFIETPPSETIPEADTTTVHVPGRNGDLIIPTGAYKNTMKKYKISSGSETANYAQVARNIAAWANSANGDYAPLEDSYDPDYIRRARFTGSPSIENILNHAGKVEITFECQPKKYLKSSISFEQITSGDTVNNSFITVARPFIIFKPNLLSTQAFAQFEIEDANGFPYILTIDKEAFEEDTSPQNPYVIDCENRMVYKAADALGDLCYKTINRHVYTSGNEFLRLNPGVNTITFLGMQNVEMRSMLWTV